MEEKSNLLFSSVLCPGGRFIVISTNNDAGVLFYNPSIFAGGELTDLVIYSSALRSGVPVFLRPRLGPLS